MADGSLLMVGLEGPQLSPKEARRYTALQPAGYILFSRNIESAVQTRQLTDDLRELHGGIEPIIAIDQEGGRVTRTKDIAPSPPSANALGKHGDMGLIADAAAHTADLLRLLGCNFNLAPVLDIDHHPTQANALRGRCWSNHNQRVIDYAGHWNRWQRKRYMASCAKHFPAGGRAESDPHHDLPSCSATLDELLADDVLPYTALMPELDAIMLAHVEFPNIDPGLPASLSPIVIRRFLRDQLGFDKHLVLTDDLDMGAIQKRYGRGEDARLAIAAGNDLALICHQTETAEIAAEAIATLPHGVIDDARQRVERFREKRLHHPPAWSQPNWDKACSAIETIRQQVPDEGEDGHAPQSPVEDY